MLRYACPRARARGPPLPHRSLTRVPMPSGWEADRRPANAVTLARISHQAARSVIVLLSGEQQSEGSLKGVTDVTRRIPGIGVSP